MMLRYCAGELFDGRMPSFRHDWVSLEEIDPNLKYAVIASEDQRFYEHNGFDFKAIEEAMEERRQGKRKRGASTITQQTAKNVFTFGTSTWLRKGIEAYYTVLIELLWSKERILEVYLNSIEMGPGIYGAEAVAQEHFNCAASELTRSNCALIAATLPNPNKFSSKNPSPYMLKRRKQILRQMRLMGN
jgi:monofunctional biosynthetic peptidoglycan transglycosylase